VAKISPQDSIKTVEVCWGNPNLRDTTFTVQSSVEDSLILKHLRVIEDSLKYEQFKKDSLYAVFQKDSIYKDFQADSTNFRRITKKINGGYNGWDYRYKLWLNARKVLEQRKDTIN
jgi:hypothetical protein